MPRDAFKSSHIVPHVCVVLVSPARVCLPVSDSRLHCYAMHIIYMS